MLRDMLGSSRDNFICGRNTCLLCLSKQENRKIKASCTRRNIMYQAECLNCREDQAGNQAGNGSDPSVGKKSGDELPKTIYLGESSKGLATRSWWHLQSMHGMRKNSFMLKHLLREHQNLNPEDLRFEWKVLKIHAKATERMINESVRIKLEMRDGKNRLMNSKVEYNRSVVPDLRDRILTEDEKAEEERLEEMIEKMKREKSLQKIDGMP